MSTRYAANAVSRTLVRRLLPAIAMMFSGSVAPVLAQQQDQEYPQKLIRIIVPFSAGGPTDLYSRTIAKHMSERFGKPVIVENRIGAQGAIGHEAIARSEPDGYTIGMISSSLSVLPIFSKNFTLSATRDFTPITQLISADYAVLVNPSFPAKNMKDLFDYVKANPAKVNVASMGGAPELATTALGQQGGVKFTIVPYKGAAPARVALLANEVQIVLESVGVAKDLAGSGRAAILAVTGAKRNPATPSIPTVSESGFPGFEAGYFFGYAGPAGLPKTIVSKLYDSISSALESTDLRKQIAFAANEAVGSTPEQFARLLADDTGRWAAVAKAAGIVPQ